MYRVLLSYRSIKQCGEEGMAGVCHLQRSKPGPSIQAHLGVGQGLAGAQGQASEDFRQCLPSPTSLTALVPVQEAAGS